MTAQNVVDMLKNRGVIDEGVAYDIAHEAIDGGKDILQVLLDFGVFSDEDQFWAAVADEIGAEHFDLSTFEPPAELVSIMPGAMAKLYGAFPVNIDGKSMHIAFTDPLNPQLVEDLRFSLGRDIVPVVARKSQVQGLIDKHYGTSTDSWVSVHPATDNGKLDATALNDTNQLEIRVFANEAHRHAVLIARLDNLGKGASGAAVQNLQLMLGV
jgi:hypothetical protein